MWQQQQNWHGGKMMHYSDKEGGLHARELSEQDRNFDVVRAIYITLDSTDSIIVLA